MKALIIIDLQNSFLRGGSLEVENSDNIISKINFIQDHFDVIIATQDWHPTNHVSFALNHEGKNILDVIELENGTKQTLWPVHCTQGTKGAEFSRYLHTNKIKLIVRKGMDPNVDSYSCFFDNNKENSTGLHGYLKNLNVDEVYLCGLAGDYCVNFSAMDAISLGYKTYIVTDAIKSVDEENFKTKIKPTLRMNGCEFISSDNLWERK